MVAVNGGEPATKRLKSSDSASSVDDVRVVDCKPLIPPAILLEDIPLTEAGLATVAKVRANESSDTDAHAWGRTRARVCMAARVLPQVHAHA
jgi:hypothetical protein